MTRTVAVIVGSLRKDSLNRKLAKALIAAAPALKCEIVEIGDMPLYNQDLETASPPPSWTAFREKVKASDAILFVTPEYNRSMPAAMKNAIDVASRPWGKNIFDKKPGAVVGGSIGAMGAFGAVHHLRQSVSVLNIHMMSAPEAYIHLNDKLFAEDGTVTDEKVKPFLAKIMDSFAAWIEQQLK